MISLWRGIPMKLRSGFVYLLLPFFLLFQLNSANACVALLNASLTRAAGEVVPGNLVFYSIVFTNLSTETEESCLVRDALGLLYFSDKGNNSLYGPNDIPNNSQISAMLVHSIPEDVDCSVPFVVTLKWSGENYMTDGTVVEYREGVIQLEEDIQCPPVLTTTTTKPTISTTTLAPSTTTTILPIPTTTTLMFPYCGDGRRDPQETCDYPELGPCKYGCTTDCTCVGGKPGWRYGRKKARFLRRMHRMP